MPKKPDYPERVSNRQVLLRYGLGCAWADNCFKCPFPVECHFKDKATGETEKATTGEWVYTDGLVYSRMAI